ncbi:MAG: patatin-like phospholipase family protein [Verrucomicrobia bacterium]|nr:patatin-like phospholipase family protein [Verrucomicrobiota bacterium]
MNPEPAVDLKAALEQELKVIKRTRARLGMESANDSTPDDLSAICLSGGGIRSAIFCLGALMALDKGKLIQQFDYLSTVSGGGYIGAWLSKLLKVIGDDHVGPTTRIFTSVQQKEKALNAAAEGDRTEFEPAALQFLRENSSYITPRKSLFSGDSWSLVAIYVRNLLLNWAILIPLLAAGLATPLWFLGVAEAIENQGILILLTLVFAGLALIYPTVVPAFKDITQDAAQRQSLEAAERSREDSEERTLSVPSFLLLRLAPFAIALLFFTIWVSKETGQGLGNSPQELSPFVAGVLGLVVGLGFGGTVLGLLIASIIVSVRRRGVLKKRMDPRLARTIFCLQTVGSFCAIPSCVFLVPHLGTTQLGFYVWFPVLATITLLMSGTIFAGLVDPLIQDDNREWWARSAGYFLLSAALWLVVGTICVGIPEVCRIVNFNPGACPGGVCFAVSSFKLQSFESGFDGFILVLSGALAYATRIEGQIAETVKWLGIPVESLRKATFGIAIVVFTAVLAVTSIFLTLEIGYGLNCLYVYLSRIFGSDWPYPPAEATWCWLFVATVALCLFSVLLSFPVNINRFSSHIAYRNRLVRTFLGASHLRRTYNPFTGFSQTDNLPLYLLMEKQVTQDMVGKSTREQIAPAAEPSQRPLHILCAAVNVAQGERLAWQERKALSFTFSGLLCGGSEFGYRPSHQFGGPRGLTLGTAVAVSGAAANSGMGFYSSPLKSFLLTLLNGRLGWWLGNPTHQRESLRESPLVAVGPLFAELFSLTNRKAGWLNASDGGHFDNTGVYEMLQRKCRRILLFDAETSRKGISNASRRARVDLNANLTLEAKAPEPFPLEKYKIEYYDSAGNVSSNGVLFRIYPALGSPSQWTSFENAYYKLIDSSFPDESLLNQFFTETLFESYRTLGLNMLESAFDPTTATSVKDLFKGLDSHTSAAR